MSSKTASPRNPIVSTQLNLLTYGIVSQDFTVPRDSDYYDRTTWEDCPRGKTSVYDADGTTLLHTMVGLRKFGYDDEKAYGLTIVPHTVVFLTKANGENAKISAFTRNGRRYWIVGSKNVSFIYEMGQLKAAMDNVHTLPKPARLESALKIAMAWDTQPQSKCAELHSLHSELADGAWTLNFEIIYPEVQHIVPYTSADIQFVFFAVTEEKPSEKGLTALHPFAARTFCTSFGLSFVTCSEEFLYNSPTYHAELDRITYQTDAVGSICSEGVVSYGMDETGMVVQLYKHKSILYDLERAMREKIKDGETRDALFSAMDTKVEKLTAGKSHPAITRWIETRLPFLKRFAAYLFEIHVLPIPEKREPTWLAAFDARFHVASIFDVHKEFFAALKEARPEKPYSLGWDLQSRWITMQKKVAP
jgi:hypothetical protein